MIASKPIHPSAKVAVNANWDSFVSISDKVYAAAVRDSDSNNKAGRTFGQGWLRAEILVQAAEYGWSTGPSYIGGLPDERRPAIKDGEHKRAMKQHRHAPAAGTH